MVADIGVKLLENVSEVGSTPGETERAARWRATPELCAAGWACA